MYNKIERPPAMKFEDRSFKITVELWKRFLFECYLRFENKCMCVSGMCVWGHICACVKHKYCL